MIARIRDRIIFEACEKSKNDYTESIFFTSLIHMRTSLQTYLHGAISEEPTTPVLMDESSIFLFLSGFTKEHILSYEELIEASISQVYTYDIPEDKKEFNIETVRRCIIDIELRPYE